MAKLALLAALITPVAFAGITSPTLIQNVGICTAYLDELGITHTPLINKADKISWSLYNIGYQYGKDEAGFALVPISDLYTDRKCHRILAEEKKEARNNAIKNARK